jgi:hypothetical protein
LFGGLLCAVVFDLESLDYIPFLDYLHLPLDPYPPLELVEMFVWKMMVDLVLVKALQILLGTRHQWACSLARRMEPLHHMIHQDELTLLESH